MSRGSRFNTWESYLYPAPYRDVLRNKFGVKNAAELKVKEYIITKNRKDELVSGEVVVARTFDVEHVKAIHRHLFQDVYEWAGELRNVNMVKAGRAFANVLNGEVERYLEDVHAMVAGTEWETINRVKFMHQTAEIFAYVNQAHPFREGNGRTSKMFLDHISDQSSFAFDFNQVSSDEWNAASQRAAPHRGAYTPEYKELFPVFHHVIIEREPPAANTDKDTSSLNSKIHSKIELEQAVTPLAAYAADNITTDDDIYYRTREDHDKNTGHTRTRE